MRIGAISFFVDNSSTTRRRHNSTQHRRIDNTATTTAILVEQKTFKGHLEFFTEPIDDNMYLLGVSTSHGRQFSPQFFLGGGMSFILMEYYYNKSSSKAELHGTIPLIVSFADFRFTPITKRITPVVGLKMGYLFFFHFLRATPYIGVRWGLCKGFGVNLGVGFPVFFVPFGEGTMEAVRLNVGIDF